VNPSTFLWLFSLYKGRQCRRENMNLDEAIDQVKAIEGYRYHRLRAEDYRGILDDMHFAEYREEAREFFKDCEIRDIREETLDKYSRYAWMVMPK